MGVIGLGAGTLAAYGSPGRSNFVSTRSTPGDSIAESQFTFLRRFESESRDRVRRRRLSLEREPPRHFNVLVVDAFSGDAIPVHLLTKEAFAVYLRHLDPAGVIAFHVSNQFLDLAPAVRRVAVEYGFDSVQIHSDSDVDRGLIIGHLGARDTES